MKNEYFKRFILYPALNISGDMKYKMSHKVYSLFYNPYLCTFMCRMTLEKLIYVKKKPRDLKHQDCP